MDRALWITWYDLPVSGHDEYLAWLHGVYMPRVLERPGFLWAAHYASEEKPLRNTKEKPRRYPAPGTVPGGHRYILLVGAEHAHAFADPMPREYHAGLPDPDRKMLSMRTGESTSIMVEEARIEGPDAGRIEANMALSPLIQLGSYIHEDDEELLAWYAQWRLPSMRDMPGCVRVRKLIAVSGWARHAILHEFTSAEARNANFVDRAKANPDKEAWSERVTGKVIHYPGSPSVAHRLWCETKRGTNASHPVAAAHQGHFYVGGNYFTTPAGQFMTGQMYVEYQIPEHRQHRFPIIMWHGGGQSGACYKTTPDGRDGWAQFFLRRGYAVYIVDQPGRGRSAYHPDAYLPLSWRSSEAIQERFTAPQRSGVWPQAHLHTQWPGSGMAGNAVFDQFYAAQLPYIESFALQQKLNRDAGAALLDRIGPAILMTHSESGAYGWLIADARPGLVTGIVAAEPSGPPVYNPKFEKDRATSRAWKGDLAKPWGLTWQPRTYAPAVTDPKELSFVEQAQPDGLGLLKCWLQKEPARKLVNLKNVPVMILTAESSFHAGYDHGTSRYLAQAGVRNTFVRLTDRGIRGNGHMMMLEKNSLQIASLIEEWLAENVVEDRSE